MSAPAKPPSRHPSVKALLDAHPGERDAKEVIRRLARSKVAQAKALGWSGPPFCPKEFSSIFDIRCKEVAHAIGGDGRILVHRDGKPVIEYASGRMPERQRFTIFHEFAHTLFPDYCAFVPHHHAPENQLSAEEKEFENLCDVAAAEMLLPFEEFSRDLARQPVACFDAIHSLRQLYVASIDATTYRLVDFETRVPCAAVFLTDQKKNFTNEGPLWVNHSCRSARFGTFIWPGTTPPPTSVTLRCYRDGTITTDQVRETWWVKGDARTWLVQAAKLPLIPESPAYPKIVALLVTPSIGQKAQRSG